MAVQVVLGKAEAEHLPLLSEKLPPNGWRNEATNDTPELAWRMPHQVSSHKLQQQLQAAQNRLNPFKNVRLEYEQRRAAQRLVAEVEEKVVLAEVDVDRAEEMISLMNSGPPTKDGLTQTQTALAAAEAHLAKALQLYEAKKEIGRAHV